MTYLYVGFPHSDIRGYSAPYRLTAAFRRLARPSSPPDAMASAMCAFLLDRTTSRKSLSLTLFLPLSCTLTLPERLRYSFALVRNLSFDYIEFFSFQLVV